jgi:transcription antitermination factor NusG
MPILPPESFTFPDNLFDSMDHEIESELPTTEGQWLVMHTKSRGEKALARWLVNNSVTFFLPLYKKRARQNGRDQTSYPPLFPGYLFVWGNVDARYCALASNQVARCLPVVDQKLLVADLKSVYRLMTSDHPLTPVQQMPPGSTVQVIAGPFAGMTGIVIRSGSLTRLVVEVRMIRQGVSVELDPAAVRPWTENGHAERTRIALIRG